MRWWISLTIGLGLSLFFSVSVSAGACVGDISCGEIRSECVKDEWLIRKWVMSTEKEVRKKFSILL